MHIISALLFGISANIDAFIVGFSYGIKKQHISIATNLIISLITFAGTLLSIGLGLKAAAFLPFHLAKSLGSGLLILLGTYYVVKYILQRRNERHTDTSALEAQSKTSLSRKEAVTLGLLLTLNNAGMGIGASFAGIHFLLTSLVTLTLSAVFLFAGNRVGARWTPAFIQKSGDLLSGLIIIVLGVYEMVL